MEILQTKSRKFCQNRVNHIPEIPSGKYCLFENKIFHADLIRIQRTYSRCLADYKFFSILSA